LLNVSGYQQRTVNVCNEGVADEYDENRRCPLSGRKLPLDQSSRLTALLCHTRVSWLAREVAASANPWQL